jgi:hypothetical protein
MIQPPGMIQLNTSPAAQSERQSPNKNTTQPAVLPHFGSEIDVAAITGISRRTLQQDRQFGRSRFPWYKSGIRVLYDLAEVERIIRRTRAEGSAAEAVGGTPTR